MPAPRAGGTAPRAVAGPSGLMGTSASDCAALRAAAECTALKAVADGTAPRAVADCSALRAEAGCAAPRAATGPAQYTRSSVSMRTESLAMQLSGAASPVGDWEPSGADCVAPRDALAAGCG